MYYVSTLAKNVYAIKVQMQDQMKREIEKSLARKPRKAGRGAG